MEQIRLAREQKLNIMNNTRNKKGLIEWALEHHQIVILLVSILVAFGVIALLVMPKNEFPSFTINQGVVVGVYPGASSKEVEETLTIPLERFLWGFKEINRAKTYSQSKDGITYVYITLKDNVDDIESFWSKFKHSLSMFKSQLPTGVLALIANDDFGDTSALLITLESKDKTYRELESYLDELKCRLRKVDAIANFRRYGVQKEQIGIYVNQDKLASYGVNSSLIMTSLLSQSATVVSGTINNGNIKAPLHLSAPYKSENDIAGQIVYADPLGNIIRLKDIATVKREYPTPSSYIENNGKRCVLLSLEMNKGNNIVKLGKDVNKVLKEFKSDLPEDVNIYRITDQSVVVGDSVNNFLKELLIAIIAVILVIMVLLPMRVASVAASTIPITIFISLGLFFALGLELNTVTLAALILCLGMIVDNSVVIIDCYLEHIGNGMDRKKATILSAKEFFKSIFSATLAISITFFPFLFILNGMFKDFVFAFPWSISIILFLSLIIAVMLVPYMQHSLIKKGIVKKEGKRSLLDIVQKSYDKLVEKCFSHPKLTIGGSILFLIIGLWIFLLLPQRLMPVAERNQFAVEITLPEGSTLDQTKIIADSLRNILSQDKRVKSVTSFLGCGSPRFHIVYAPSVGGSNFAQFIVNTESNRATTELLDKYTAMYANYFPEANVRFKQLDFSEAAYPIEVRLTGDNMTNLIAARDSVVRKMSADSRLSLVHTNYLDPTPVVNINMNSDEANRLGITKSLAAINLAMRFGDGVPMATLWEGDYPLSVMLKDDNCDSLGFKDLGNTYIKSIIPQTNVPLRQVADISPDWNFGQIVRRNGVRTVSIQADVARGENVSKMTTEVDKMLTNLKLPDGITRSFGGALEKDNEALQLMIKGLLISILILFFILLFHFKKINLALLILASLTLSIPGTSIGLLIMGKDMSLTAILGIVSLMGIIARNGIIMIDYAELLRGEGLNAFQAAKFAAKRRMRPIFLTSAAASVGVIPMIISGSTLWSPLGSVVCFGTMISMILIITVLPVAYWLIFRGKDGGDSEYVEKAKLITEQ